MTYEWYLHTCERERKFSDWIGRKNKLFTFCHHHFALFFSLLTVLFPKLRTRHFKYAVPPTSTVTFFDTDTSKYGPLSNGFWESSPLPISKPLSLSRLLLPWWWYRSTSSDDDGVIEVRVTELNWFSSPVLDVEVISSFGEEKDKENISLGLFSSSSLFSLSLSRWCRKK